MSCLAAMVSVIVVVWIRQSGSPSILLITLDTTRADRIGCYGYDRVETPRLDDLAQHGVLFERAYASAPMTGPSHASIFTGLFPPEHGVYTNGTVALEPSIPVLAEEFQREGYATSAFVASIVLQKRIGFDRGFDVYDDDLSAAEFEGDDLHRSRDGRHVIDAAIHWLENREQKSSPFFCWVHLFDPHEPYLAHPEEFDDTYQDHPYDGEVAYVDRQMGRLFDSLEKLGLKDNLVVVVVGDHGESLGEHGEEAHGYMLYDSTLRVPLIIADPRLDIRNHRVTTPVSLVDVFPTVLDLAGLPKPEAMAPRSLYPALMEKTLPPRVCYSQTMEPYLEARWAPLQCITTERWRYIRTTIPELYDLQNDPAEVNNLASEEPDLVIEFDGNLAFFEDNLKPRWASALTLSDREKRSLESLGYAGGSLPEIDDFADGQQRPDIKEMIGHLNNYFDATELMKQGQFDEASQILQPLVEDVPNFVRARFLYGRCLTVQEKFEDAIKWLNAALEVDPNYEPAHVLAGFSHLKLRQFTQAEEHLQRAIELNVNSEMSHLFLGETYQRQGKFQQAVHHYEESLRINPQNPSVRQLIPLLRATIRGS
ncbi:MAG: sulfatase-like hydrolase/transferase [Planctomycetota bacterium]|nr:sulfatase-like hydrolase/transferase [Planctomycetota bacterium]